MSKGEGIYPAPTHQSIEELDSAIMKIQKSTRAMIPAMIPVHEVLRSKYKWYYNWSANSASKTIHWVILFVYLIGASSFGANLFYNPKSTQAASAKTWYSQKDWGQWELSGLATKDGQLTLQSIVKEEPLKIDSGEQTPSAQSPAKSETTIPSSADNQTSPVAPSENPAEPVVEENPSPDETPTNQTPETPAVVPVEPTPATQTETIPASQTEATPVSQPEPTSFLDKIFNKIRGEGKIRSANAQETETAPAVPLTSTPTVTEPSAPTTTQTTEVVTPSNTETTPASDTKTQPQPEQTTTDNINNSTTTTNDNTITPTDTPSSGATSTPTSVVEEQLTTYKTTGTALNAFRPVPNEKVYWLSSNAETKLNGQSIAIEFSTDNILWVQDISKLASSEAVYIKITFATNDEKISPVLESLTINYSRSSEKPRNIAPAENAQVKNTDLTLSSSTFADPDKDKHQASQWIISKKSGNYTGDNLVLNSGADKKHLTSTSLKRKLKDGRYFWRVRYQDSTGAWSLWSDESTFVYGKDNEESDIVEKRTEKTRTYDKGNNIFKITSTGGVANYKENYQDSNEQWKKINSAHTVDFGDYVLYDQMPSTVKVFKDRIGYEIESRKTGDKYRVELQDVEGGKPKVASLTDSQSVLGLKTIQNDSNSFWARVFNKAIAKDALNLDESTSNKENLKFDFEISENGVRLWKTIKGDEAPKQFKWKVTKQNGSKQNFDDLSFREDPEAFEINTGKDHKKVEISTKQTKLDANSFIWQETAPKTDLKIDTDVLVKSPTSDTVISSGAYSGYDWYDTSLAYVEGGGEAWAIGATFDTQNTKVLVLKGFGFTGLDGATIDGITVNVNWNLMQVTGGWVYDSLVQLYNGTSLAGDNLATTNSNVTPTQYGTSSTTWNANLTAEQIMGANFGVGLAAEIMSGEDYGDGANRALVDNAVISVYYTSGASTPTAPTDVTIGTITATGFTVGWTDASSDETGFKVYTAAGNADCSAATYSGTPDYTTAADATSQAITAKSVNTQYCAKVIATNAAGDSAAAYASPKYTLANVPSAPTVDTATASSLKVTINQNSNPSNTTYAIYNETLTKYIGADGVADEVAEVWQDYATWGGASGIVNTGLTANTSYTYKVKAKNGDNTATALSTGGTLSTLEATPNAASSISIGTIATTGFTVAWTDNSANETGFKVFTAAGNADCSAATYSGTPDYTTAADAISQAITSKSVNTQYCAKVIATNAAGDSAAAYALPKYTLANVPSAPTVDTATSSSLKITIDQNSNPAATTYAIYNETLTKYIGADGVADEVAEVWQDYATWGGASGIVNTGLTANTSYTYKVKAKNGDNTATALSTGGTLSTLEAGITISGTVYTAESKATNIGANKTIAVTVDGTESVRMVETDGSGAFSMTDVVVSANSGLAIYVEDESGVEANLVTQAVDNSTNITGLELYTDKIVLTHATAGPMTNTILKTALGVLPDSNIHYTNPSGSQINFDEAYELFIITGKTYTPGAAIGVIGALDINGTFNPEGNSLSVTGDIDLTGSTVDAATSTLNLTKTSGSQTLTSGGKTLTNIALSGGATKVIADALDVNGTFSQAEGVLDLNTNDPNVNIAGGITISGGTVTKGSGTVILDGDLNYSAIADINFGNLQIGTSPDTTTLASNLTTDNLTIALGDSLITAGYNITVNGDVDLNGTLDASTAGGRTTTINVAGSWDATGGTFTAGDSTVNFNGASTGKTIKTNAQAFYNLTIDGVTGVGSGNTSATIAGSGANDATVGDTDWTGPENATAEDGTASNITTYCDGATPSSITSKYLYGSGFSFNVPATATIDGVKVRVKMSQTQQGPTGATESSIRIHDDSGWAGDDKSASSSLPGVLGWSEYGGAADNWTASLTPSKVNSASFGAGVSVVIGCGTTGGEFYNAADVDAIEMTVYYTDASSDWTLQDNLTVSNTLAVSDGTLTSGANTVTTKDFTQSGGILTAPSTNMYVSGNFAHSAGTFTHNSGTVNLTGAGGSTQVISGSTTFNNLSSTAAAARTITFTAGTTQTVAGTWTATGSADQLLTLQSSTTSVWNINPAAWTVSYVNVSYSTNQASSFIKPTNSTNGGNNTNWFGLTVSGNVFTAENESTNIGADKTIGLSVNGGAKTTVETTAGGAFSKDLTLSANDTLTIFVDDETGLEANLVTQAVDSSSDITGLKLYTDKIVLTHETAGPMTNTLLNTANNSADDDIHYTDGGAFDTAYELFIQTGKTYTPGGTVTSIGDFDINGTFIPEANTINVAGSWDATGGTFTKGTSTINFNGYNTGKTITSSNQDFYNITINGQNGSSENGLVTYWRMDETSGTNVADSSTSGNDGTTEAPGTVSSNGVFGTYARSFPGSGYAQKTSPTNLPSGSASRTINVWFKLNNATWPVGEFKNVFGYGDNTGSLDRFQVQMQNVGGTYTMGANLHEVGQPYFVWTPDTNWHQATLTLPAGATKSNQVDFYLDGVLQTMTGGSTSDLNTSTSYLSASTTAGINNGWFDGLIDEARVYNRELSTTEIADLYNANSLAHWDLSDNLTATNSLTVSGGTLVSGSNTVTTLGYTQTAGAFTAPSTTMTVSGNFAQSAGTLTHNSGAINFTKSGDQTLEAASSLNSITKSGTGTIQVTNRALTAAGTATIGSGTVLDINGQNTTIGTLVNNGFFKLKGKETTTITTMDVNSGVVEYAGYNVAENITIKDFNVGASAVDYFNLKINDANSTKATFVLGAALNVDGNLDITAGTLDASASNYQINVAGDWVRTGSFTQREGKVVFDKASGTQTINDGTTFYDIEMTASAARTIAFEGNTTNNMNAWTATGSSGQLLTLQSTDTNAWTVNPTSAIVSYTSVSRSTNTGVAFCATYSTDGLNNTGWNFSETDSCSGTIQFTATSSNGSEETTSVNLEVSLGATQPGDATVDYAVTGGTATGTGTDYTLASGTATITAGSTTTNIQPIIVNDALDETNETIIVTISNPTNSTLGTNTVHTYTINDDDTTPTIAFTATSSNAAESVTPANLELTLSAASGQEVTVDYAVTGGTATGTGTDYNLASGTATIAAGSTTTNISPIIVNDTLDEDNETIEVTISNPSNATLGTNTVNTYTINDDDSAPTVQFTAISSNNNESTTSVDLEVSLSAASGKTVTIGYAPTGGTATGTGTDYTLASDNLNFAAGETTKNITLTIINDTLDEDNETVIVTIATPINATLGANTVHTYTINDDDATPTVAFTATSSNAAESVTPANLELTLSAASGQNVTVDYAVTGGTATGSGTDYTLASGTATITAGSTTTNIQPIIVNDTLDEENETLVVAISSPSNATLGTNTTHTYTINDNDNAPTIAFTALSSNGAESATPANLELTLSVSSGKTVTVDYAVTGGTATGGGVDYTLASGTATIIAGSTTTNIQPVIIDNAIDDSDRTIIVTISNPTNATLGTSTEHTYTINDDDELPEAASGVQITNIGTTSFDVVWTDNSTSETGFKIFVSTTATDDCSGATYPGAADYTAAANATTQAVIGKAINTRYCAKIITTNTIGDAAAGYSLPKYTLAAIPTSPTVAANYSELNSYFATITLGANSNPATTNYKTTYDTAVGGSFSDVLEDWTAHTDGAVLTHTNLPAGLTCNQTYYYKVQARNGDGTVTLTSTGSDTTPPCAPESLVAGSLTSSSTNLTWAEVAGPSATYTVSFGTDALATNLGETSAISATNLAKSGLSAETTYYFKTKATNTYGTGAWSAVESLATEAAPIGSADHLVMVLPGQSFTSGVGVTGTPSHQTAGTSFTATIYAVTSGNEIYTSYNNAITFSTPTDSFIATYGNSSGIPCTNTTLSSGTATTSCKFYEASSNHLININSNLGSSSIFTVDPAITSATVSQVSPTSRSVQAGQTAAFTIFLKDAYTNVIANHLVTAVSDQVGDVVTYSASATSSLGGIVVYVSSALVHTSSITITDSSSSITLATHPTVQFTVPSIANPTNFTGTAGDKQTNLSWRNPSSAYFSHIHIYRSLTAGQLGELVADNISTTSYNDRGLTNNTTYYYTLKAVDIFGNQSSGTSQLALTPTVLIDNEPPTIPLTLRATAIGQTNISLAWNGSTDNVGVVGYKLYNAETGIQIAATSGLTYSLDNLTPATTYHFYVVAYDAAGNVSARSNILTVTTLPTSDGGDEQTQTFLVFANMPNEAWVGQALSQKFKVLATDGGGSIAEDYRGSVYFDSTDEKAGLVWDNNNPYQFTEQNAGQREFEASDIVFNTSGEQRVWVTDGQSRAEARILVKGESKAVGTLHKVQDSINSTTMVQDTVATTTAALLAIPIIINLAIGFGSLMPQLAYWFSNLLQLFGLKQRRKPWGVVFNSQTGQPVAFASVKIYDKEYNRLLDSVITDSAGRFGFLVRPGKFIVKVRKNGFVFPSRYKVSSFFDNVYTGSIIDIQTKEQSTIEANIPLDPETKISLGLNMMIAMIKLNRFFQRISIPLLIAGTIFAVVMLMISYDIVYVLALVLYALIFVLQFLRSLKSRPYGVVSDVFDHPIEMAIVRIYEKKTGRLAGTDVTDIDGRFRFLVNPGVYFMTASKPGFIDFKSHITYLEKEKTAVSSNMKLKELE